MASATYSCRSSEPAPLQSTADPTVLPRDFQADDPAAVKNNICQLWARVRALETALMALLPADNKEK